MGHGGARSRSGPAPDPNALRRSRDERQWTKLPASGRGEDAPAPEWPLPEDVGEAADLQWEREHVEELREKWAREEDGRSARSLGRRLEEAERALVKREAYIAARSEQETGMWARLWRLPQAVVWEADHAHLQVAMYVRAFLEASRAEASPPARTLAARLAGELLLTPSSLHSMKYVIDDVLPGASAPDLSHRAAGAPATGAQRSRFKVVSNQEDAS